jgi:hypothetical protein
MIKSRLQSLKIAALKLSTIRGALQSAQSAGYVHSPEWCDLGMCRFTKARGERVFIW